MRNKFFLPIFLFVLFLSQLKPIFSQALGAPSRPGDSTSEDVDTLQYRKALASIEKMSLENKKMSSQEFTSLSWSAKTAVLNYICSTLPAQDCRNILSVALQDKALVIRDHALKIILNSQMFLPEEKRAVAKAILDDPRNYRNNYPFWIIGHANAYISAQLEKKSHED